MKIAIFGGTFDPVHNEHIALIKAAIAELALDRMIIVPVFLPTYKGAPLTPYDDRVAMLKLALLDAEVENCQISHAERDLGFRYAYQTQEYFRDLYPEDRVIYLIGSDSFNHIYSWKEPSRVLTATELCAVRREGHSIDTAVRSNAQKAGARITVLKYVGANISSSLIRGALALGAPCDGLARCTRDYIGQKGLYRYAEDMLDRLKKEQSAELFEHTLSTTLFALSYANRSELTFEQIFTAAVLHDNAKEIISDKYPDILPKVRHQYLGADRARDIFGVEDENIIDAIRCHTTAKPDMSPLAMLVYVADKIEPMRNFKGIEPLRGFWSRSLELCFLMCLRLSYKHICANGKEIDPLTAQAHAYYKEITDGYLDKLSKDTNDDFSALIWR